MIRETQCSHPLVSVGGWFQDPPQIPKSTDAQVLLSAPGPASVDTTSRIVSCNSVCGGGGGNLSLNGPIPFKSVQTGKGRANETVS